MSSSSCPTTHPTSSKRKEKLKKYWQLSYFQKIFHSPPTSSGTSVVAGVV